MIDETTRKSVSFNEQTFKSEIRRTLCNQAVQVFVVGSLDSQAFTTDIVDSLVIDHEAAVGVLKGCMCGEDRVVRLHHRCCNRGSWIDAEFQLGLLAVIDRETLHQKSSKARSSSTAKGMEDKETLKT